MKLDFIINSLADGGAERVMATLANSLCKKYSIRIITFTKIEEDVFDLNNEIHRVTLSEGTFENHTIRAIKNLNHFYRNKSNRPDVLISFIHMNNFIAILIGKLRGIKVIVSEHTNHTVVVSKKVKLIRECFYRYADATTVLTSFDVNYYTKHGANVIIMPNPLYLPKKIKPYSKRKSTILAVGNLDRYIGKGFDELLYLIAPILRNNPTWTLIIAGGGDKGHHILKDITKQLKMEDKVIFTGFRNDIKDLMQDSQIFVLTSKYEGLPMGLMEALSNGMTCVAYDCPSGPNELIAHNFNGLLVKNQDTSAMKDNLLNLVQDYTLRESLAMNAPSSMQAYGIENIMIKWEKLIYSILNFHQAQ